MDLRGAVIFCLEALVRSLRTYLVVSHVLFDDHLDFDATDALRCWYDRNALEGTEYGGDGSVE